MGPGHTAATQGTVTGHCSHRALAWRKPWVLTEQSWGRAGCTALSVVSTQSPSGQLPRKEQARHRGRLSSLLWHPRETESPSTLGPELPTGTQGLPECGGHSLGWGRREPGALALASGY